ncbi:tyrosine-type recombinase/integrase [Streptomyces sp. 5.8]|uniref:tyrosine-type recombinase/integrase n=1 Tax=Streptomyces sp. 5.8 TaxID=3406571 RepID=UPI003BB50029
MEEVGSIVMPEDYDDATRAKLAELEERAKQHVQGKRPKNTTDGYEQDWRDWQRFAYAWNLPLTAITPGSLVAFVEWLWLQPGQKDGSFLAPNTIRRRLSGVVVTGRQRFRLDLNDKTAEAARELLRRKIKEMEEAGEQRGRGQAPALLIPHLQAISAACPDDLEGLRDRAMILTHFVIAGREHEVAALRVRDIVADEHGLVVDIRVSKTRPRKVPVPYGSRPSTCAVRAWAAWQQARQAGPDEYAFCGVHWKAKTLLPGGLTAEGVGDVVTRAGNRTNLGIVFTGHSPRRGLATEAKRAGRDRSVIAKQGGWAPNSVSMEGYFEDADQWEDNALIGIGL